MLDSLLGFFGVGQIHWQHEADPLEGKRRSLCARLQSYCGTSKTKVEIALDGGCLSRRSLRAFQVDCTERAIRRFFRRGGSLSEGIRISWACAYHYVNNDWNKKECINLDTIAEERDAARKLASKKYANDGSRGDFYKAKTHTLSAICATLGNPGWLLDHVAAMNASKESAQVFLYGEHPQRNEADYFKEYKNQLSFLMKRLQRGG